MRKILFCLLFILPTLALAQPDVSKHIVGKWKVNKITTSDEGLNELLQLQNLKLDAIISFHNGRAKLHYLNKQHEAGYSVNGKQITFTGENLLQFNKSTLKSEIKHADSVEFIIPTELTKRIIAEGLKEYSKNGGEPFIAKLIASVAESGVYGIIKLNRDQSK